MTNSNKDQPKHKPLKVLTNQQHQKPKHLRSNSKFVHLLDQFCDHLDEEIEQIKKL